MTQREAQNAVQTGRLPSDLAAALAAGSAALDGDIDASKKASYIEHAENLFKMADASKSDDVYNDSDASGFYRSSHFYDELSPVAI